VIVAFAGDVPEVQVEGLRAWIRDEGVATVWQALEGAFRRGPRAVRACLTRQLAGRLTAAEDVTDEAAVPDA
jgi:hypothetical protein